MTSGPNDLRMARRGLGQPRPMHFYVVTKEMVQASAGIIFAALAGPGARARRDLRFCGLDQDPACSFASIRLRAACR